MLIYLVSWNFIVTFVVGKIIYNKKCTYLHRQVHLVITPIEWSYVRSVICANKTNVHLKAQNQRRLWVGGIGFAPMQTYRKSECLPHSPFCYQPILIGCWLWKPPEDVYILFFFWIKGDGDKLDLIFFNPHTWKEI